MVRYKLQPTTKRITTRLTLTRRFPPTLELHRTRHRTTANLFPIWVTMTVRMLRMFHLDLEPGWPGHAVTPPSTSRASARDRRWSAKYSLTAWTRARSSTSRLWFPPWRTRSRRSMTPDSTTSLASPSTMRLWTSRTQRCPTTSQRTYQIPPHCFQISWIISSTAGEVRGSLLIEAVTITTIKNGGLTIS